MDKEEMQKQIFDNFKGNLRISIPVELMKDKDLSPTDKMLYVMIDFHSYFKGYCWVTNGTLAEEINASSRTIQRSLETLELKGYIRREIKFIKGRNQRLIYTTSRALEMKSIAEKNNFKNEDYYEEMKAALDYKWI